jgi:vancomycin resistance protein VanW
LIYWITLHTQLIVTERWRHNYDVFPDTGRDRPFASGATCSFNYVDLQIKNTTQNNYQLILKLENDYLIGEWLSDVKQNEVYKVIEKDHEINHQSWGGYTRHNKLFKEIFNSENGEILEEFICENHAVMMYEPLLTSGN